VVNPKSFAERDDDAEPDDSTYSLNPRSLPEKLCAGQECYLPHNWIDLERDEEFWCVGKPDQEWPGMWEQADVL